MSNNILHNQELDFLYEEYREIRREFINVMGDPKSFWVDIVDAKNGLVYARDNYYRIVQYTKDRHKNDKPTPKA